MDKKLQIAFDLWLPIEAVTESLAFLGRKGQGKSYAAQLLAELMYKAHAQFVVLDPVGIWYGLRLASDGKKPGLPIPVLGGLRGDIPLEPGAGAMIADLIVDRAVSVVLDVSQFESDSDKARFGRTFADRFYFRKKASPSAVHLFIEECQEFVPQNPLREEAHMLHAFTRIAKIGRNFGIGVSLISQRPQEVNKKVLNLAELLFAFQLTGPQERKTLQGWIADKGIDEDIDGILPKLERGAPHAWSPAWLKISKVVHINKKTTLDASSTPKVGVSAAARELSPIDLEALRKEMASTIERAKADDPRELRREILDLRKQVAGKASGPSKEWLAELEQAHKRDVAVAFEHGRADAAKRAGGFLSKLQAAASELAGVLAKETVATLPQRANTMVPVFRKPISSKSPASRTITNGALSGPEQRILDAVAWWRMVNQTSPTRVQIAVVSKYRPGGGAFENPLSSLRTKGLIDYPSAGRACLTHEGSKLAREPEYPPSTEDLHERVMEILDGPQRKLLRALIDKYPSEMSREDLAAATDYDHNGGAFQNPLSALRSVGLIDYPAPGKAVALPILFLQ